MENAAESASTSSLAWRWAIEALASSTDLKPSLLHDVIDQAKELPEDSRKNAGEMVALKCLEGLFGSLDYSGRNVVPSAQESKVGFDSSESCEDVVKRVFKETPKSALRVAGPDMSKWDVIPFVAQKRASMRCTLHQLKDSILDGTHPSADYLMQKSGLMPVNKLDRNSLNTDNFNEHCRRVDSSSSDPQARKETSKGSPLHLEHERRLSVADPSSSSLLPSKRSIVDLTSKNEARQLPGCDDGFANVKKLKHHSSHTLYSGQEEASSHGREVLEDSPERVMPENERDGTDHLDEHQMTSVEDRVVEEEHFGWKKSGQNTTTDDLHPVELSTPRYTISDPTEDDEMHGVINVEKAKDGNELPIEPKSFNKSLVVGNLHNITTSDSEPNFGDDNHHANEMNTSSHSEFQPNTVTTPYPTEDDEMHGVISVEKEKDGNERPIEPKAFNKPPAVGNLHNITTSDSECNFGDDNHHANEMEFQPKTVTTSYPTEDDEMHDAISAKKAKDGSELPIEQKAFNKSPAVGNLYNITTSDSERNFGDDNHHTNEMNTSSHSEFQPKTVTTPYPTEDDEMHDAISAKKAKDGIELPIEPKAFNKSSAVGNLHNITTSDYERNFGDDNHLANEMSTSSHSEFQPKTVTTPYPTEDDEMHDVISAKKEKDGSELPIEPKAFNKSPAIGNVHSITTSDSERNFGDDNHHANEMNTFSHSEFQPNTVTMPYPTEDDEMHDIISTKKAKDGSELPIEPKTFNNSPAEGNLHNIITGVPERNFGGNNDHVNEMNTLSHSEFQPKTVATDIDVGMNAHEEGKDMLSDSDEYRSRRVDIAIKKKEFLSSQCMADHDSFLLADGRELTVCVKCNQGGQLLSCDISDCPLVVHDKCLGSSARINDEGDFVCPFCSYSLAISEYLEAKKNAALAKKNVATFIRTGLGHQSIVIKEALQQKYRNPSRKAGVEGVAKVCEDVDLADKDNQVTLDGEQVDQVVDHEFPTVTDFANSNHRETKESPLRAAHELVDQECEGNVAEATEQHDICETLHEGQRPVEVADTEEGLEYQTDDNEEEPSYAINIEGIDNDESIISRYSIRFRRKYRQLVSSYFNSTTASGSALGATGWLRSASPRSAPGSGSAPSPLSKLNT